MSAVAELIRSPRGVVSEAGENQFSLVKQKAKEEWAKAIEPVIDGFYRQIRELWTSREKNYWDIGDLILLIRVAHKKATNETLQDEVIAEKLGLDLTGQRIGQLRETSDYWPQELRDPEILHTVFHEARKAAGGKPANEMITLVKKYPTTKAIREHLKKKEKKCVVEKSYKFAVISPREKFEGTDKSHGKNLSVKYNGLSNPDIENREDEKAWIYAAVDAVGAALAALAMRVEHYERDKPEKDFRKWGMNMRENVRDSARWVLSSQIPYQHHDGADELIDSFLSFSGEKESPRIPSNS
jgi:hypothetical protein